MEWKPATKEDVRSAVRAELDELAPDVRDTLAARLIEPEAATILRSGKSETIFIVARSGIHVVFFDDIEDNFQIGVETAGVVSAPQDYVVLQVALLELARKASQPATKAQASLQESALAGSLIVLALGIGMAVIGGAASAAHFLGSQINLGEEWPTLLTEVLWVAAPFAVFALTDVPPRGWLAALIVTVILWSALVCSVYLSHGGGANIGMGLLLLVSPLIVATSGYWAARQQC